MIKLVIYCLRICDIWQVNRSDLADIEFRKKSLSGKGVEPFHRETYLSISEFVFMVFVAFVKSDEMLVLPPCLPLLRPRCFFVKPNIASNSCLNTGPKTAMANNMFVLTRLQVLVSVSFIRTGLSYGASSLLSKTGWPEDNVHLSLTDMSTSRGKVIDLIN